MKKTGSTLVLVMIGVVAFGGVSTAQENEGGNTMELLSVQGLEVEAASVAASAARQDDAQRASCRPLERCEVKRVGYRCTVHGELEEAEGSEVYEHMQCNLDGNDWEHDNCDERPGTYEECPDEVDE